MTDLASLGLSIDSSQAVKAASDLDNLTNSAGRTEKGITSAIREATKAINALNGSVNTATGAMQKALANVERPAQQAARSFDDIRASLDPLYGSSRRYATTVDEITAAVKRGEVTQAQANRVLDMAAQRYLGVSNAIDEHRRTVDQLRASLDPVFAASKRYEAAQEQLSAAVRAGAISQADANRVLSMAAKSYLEPVAPIQRTTTALAALEVAQDRAARGSSQFAQKFTQVGYQVQDTAVQLGMGANAMMVIGQQAPQALGVLGMSGPLGIAVSGLATLIAVGAAIAPMFFNMGKEAKTTSDLFGLLTSAVDRYRASSDLSRSSVADLTAEFGSQAEAMRDILRLQAELDQQAALRSLRDTVQSMAGLSTMAREMDALIQKAEGFGLLNNEMRAFLRETKLSADQVVVLGQGVDRLGKSKGPEEVAAAARDLLGFLEGAYGTVENMPVSIQTLANNLTRAVAESERLTATSNGTAGAIAGAADEAARLAANLNISAIGAEEEAARQVGVINAQMEALRNGQDQVLAGKRATLDADKAAYAEGMRAIGMNETLIQAALRTNFQHRESALATEEAYRTLQDTMRGTGSASASAGRTATKAAREMTQGLTLAQVQADKLREEFEKPWKDVIDGAVEWMVDGFKGGFDSLMDLFKNALKQMAVLAISNPIRLSMGLGGAGAMVGTAASAGSAASGGGASVSSGLGFLSQMGGFVGSMMTGITAPLQAGISAAMEGGLSAGFKAWSTSANFGASGALGLGAQIGSYLGPAMLGMGAGNLIAGGYSIGGNGNLINGIGAAVGAAILGPIGGLIGGALGGLANRLFGRKLTGYGIEGGFNSDGFYGNSYQKYSGGWFSSDKTKRQDLDPSVYSALSEAFDGVETSIMTMADTLGLATGALDAFNFSFKFSTKGLSEDQISERLQEELLNAGDAMAELVLATDKYMQSGETALETMTRLAQSLGGVNAIMDTLGHSFHAAGLEGADLASKLAELFGGLDAMGQATEAYYQAFYTEEQRRETMLRQMTEQLGELNVTMPRTREQFMMLVEAQDLTTERGREVYAALIQLAEGMNFVLPTVRNFSAEIAALAGTVATDLQTAISGAESAAQTYAQSARLWYQTAASLRQFIRDLNNSTLAYINPQEQLRANRAYFETLMKRVQGGDVEAAKSVGGAATDLLTSLRQTSRTQAEYATAAAQVTSGLNLAAGIADLEGANDDVLVSLYKEQISVLTSLQNFLQYQGLTEDAIKQLPKDLQELVRDFDGTLGNFDKSLGSIEDAIKEVSDFSYEALQERLKVNVDLIAKANVPEYIRGLLDAANDGIRSSIDFIVRQDLPPDMKWIAITGQSTLTKQVKALLSGNSSPRAIKLALEEMSRHQVDVKAVLSSDMTDRQKKLLELISGNSKGTITLGGSFDFDPSKSFGVWYEDATKANITNPISGLRSSIDALRQAMINEAANGAKAGRVDALNSFVSGLTQNAAGATFANDAQIAEMAKIAGINTAGMNAAQVRKSLVGFASDDLLSGIVYDPTGTKGQSYRKEEALAPYRTTIAAAQARIFELMKKHDVYLQKPGALGILENGAVRWENGVEFLKNGRKLDGSIYNEIFGTGGPWKQMWSANDAFYETIKKPISAFANGGAHMGGLRLVGERGPELEATGPARIYSSRQTRDMLGNDEVAAELRALREENRQLLMALNESNRKTAKTLEKWDRIGQPPEQAATGTAA